MAMYSATKGVLNDDDDDEDEEGILADMPPLDGSDDEAPITDGEDSDVGAVSPDEKEQRDDALSVIATPGPIAEPNTEDEAFIKRPSESESEQATDGQLLDDDADYVPSDTHDTDADDDDDDEDDKQ